MAVPHSSYPNQTGAYWEVTAKNDSGSAQQVNIRVICATGVPSYRVEYRVSGSIPSGGNGQVTAICPSGWTSMGGGYVDSTGSPFGTFITNVSRVEGTGWRVRAVNTSGGNANFAAAVTCADGFWIGAREVYTSWSFVGPGGQQFPTLQCPANRKITGGGFSKSPVDNWTVVSASLPTSPGWKWNHKNLNPSVTYTIENSIVCFA